jgi:hypothetical protein
MRPGLFPLDITVHPAERITVMTITVMKVARETPKEAAHSLFMQSKMPSYMPQKMEAK